MKTILATLFAFFLLLTVGDATIDGTQLTDGRKPDRLFSKALGEAGKALEADAAKYACTSVRAIAPPFKGGWRFQFGSAERRSVTIHVHRDGKFERSSFGPDEHEFPPAPGVSIVAALEVADALVQRRLKGFFFTGADWYAANGSWSVFFYHPSKAWTIVTVDPSRSATLGSVNRPPR